MPGWVEIPKRIGTVPFGLPPLLSVRSRSRPSIVWLLTVCM
jgi:hypothetical protein